MWKILHILAFLVLILQFLGSESAEVKKPIQLQQGPCNLSLALIAEIKSYQPIADRIINAALNGDFKGRTYNELEKFVDIHINRLTGTPELEKAIDYMMMKMDADGLVNVKGEDVVVPLWRRGAETATLVEPTFKHLRIIGLGSSAGTGLGGLLEEAIVVHSFDELDEMKDLVQGKIVIYNQGWLGSYGQTQTYRSNGPQRAAEYGAVAVLVESLTPYSLDTPHTGHTNFVNGTRIPAAAITKEDAQLLSRIYSRGERIVLNLTMDDEMLAPVTSRNVFGEIVGSTLPDEIVGVSGHIDAWDVGQGAMDDAGGCFISVEALALIKHLELTPRRTMQAILWTAEEFGLIGVQSFVNNNKADMIKYNAVFESDGGTFRPRGLDFAGSIEAGCIVEEILKLTSAMNTTSYARYPSVGSDISLMVEEGVPGLDLNNANEQYFYYHHSPADVITVLDRDDLDMNTALWATVSYVLADLSVSLPREAKPIGVI